QPHLRPGSPAGRVRARPPGGEKLSSRGRRTPREGGARRVRGAVFPFLFRPSPWGCSQSRLKANLFSIPGKGACGSARSWPEHPRAGLRAAESSPFSADSCCRGLLSSDVHLMARKSALPATPVASLSHGMLWKSLAIVFLTVTISDLVVDSLGIQSFLLASIVTALVSMVLTLPLLFIEVILPAVQLITAESAFAAEARLKAILQSVSDAVVISDLEGVIHFVNRAAEQMQGYPPGHLAGRQVRDLTSQEIENLRLADVSAFLAGEPCTLLNQGPKELPSVRASGEVFPIELTWNTLPPVGAAGK